MFLKKHRVHITRLSYFILIAFYLFAGFNHFRDPEFYYPLIPPYLHYIEEINIISGILEVLLAIGLIPKKTQRFSAYGIIMMLLAFIPAHVYFIQLGDCISDSLCVPAWVALVRLIVVHPILIYWVWKHREGFIIS